MRKGDKPKEAILIYSEVKHQMYVCVRERGGCFCAQINKIKRHASC